MCYVSFGRGGSSWRQDTSGRHMRTFLISKGRKMATSVIANTKIDRGSCQNRDSIVRFFDPK